MKYQLISVIFIVGIVGSALQASTINLSEAEDISRLSISKAYPEDKTIGHRQERISFHIDPEDVSIHAAKIHGYVNLKVNDLSYSGKPGEPQVPMATIIVKLPKDCQPTRVEVTDGTCQEIREELNIVPVPEPGEWRIGGAKGGELIPDAQVYSLNSYFPGKLVCFDYGSDGEHCYVFVRVFPVQFIPAQKRAFLITDAKINLFYRKKEMPLFDKQRTDAECVIICPAEFQTQAESLASFHQNDMGIATDIITNQWIDSNYEPAPDPPYTGYAQTQPSFIQGYDYELAKKIISYLRDDVAHPNLIYITLIGDAEYVPSSYYYWFSPYEEMWLPTDFFYSSPDYDYVPNYQIGRLSVSDTIEAKALVTKLDNWYQNVNWQWFKNTVLSGGNPFSSIEYYGELIISDAVNHEDFSGNEITKCLFTDGEFTASAVRPFLTTEQTGIFYQISHGSGSAVIFDDGSHISASALLGYEPQVRVPIVICIGCVCAAFDTDIDNTLSFATSFGEAVLKSQAGGIAYIGGPRNNYGTPSYYLEHGNLFIIKEWYMADMLTRVADCYHAGADDLGDLTKEAMFNYVANNSMDNTLNKWTLFSTTLLGDPALQVPTQVPGTNYILPFLASYDSLYYDNFGYAVHHITSGDTVDINSNTNGPWVKTKYIDAGILGPTIGSIIDYTTPFVYNLMPADNQHLYLMRTEAADGKEGWFYTLTTTGKIAVDGDTIDWSQYGYTPIAVDPQDFTIINFDLTTLYMTDDEDNWYIGFHQSGGDYFQEDYYLSALLAVDSKPGGYTGEEGVTQDAAGYWVCFGDAHPVDYEIYLMFLLYYPPYCDATLREWTGNGYWLSRNCGLAAYDYDCQFGEVAIPKDSLDNPDTLYCSLYSACEYWPGWSEYSPALDAVPSDPATIYDSLVFGPEYANTITQFVMVISQTGIEEENQSVFKPLAFNVMPSLFSHNTTFSFEIQENEHVSLDIYDVTGRRVCTILDAPCEPAPYNIKWKGNDDADRPLPNGIYFARLSIDNQVITKKIIMVK